MSASVLAAVRRRSEGRDCLGQDSSPQIVVQVLPIGKISASPYDVFKKQAQRRVLVKVQAALRIQLDENVDVASLCCATIYDGPKECGVKNPARS